jgi:proteic killer suppression protein
MDVEFANEELKQLETDKDFTADYPREIVKGFRKRMQAIRSALDERDLRAIKSNHFEKLKGSRGHQHSIRINKQMRLVFEIQPGVPKNTIRIIEIEDYH